MFLFLRLYLSKASSHQLQTAFTHLAQPGVCRPLPIFTTIFLVSFLEILRISQLREYSTFLSAQVPSHLGHSPPLFLNTALFLFSELTAIVLSI